MLDGDVDAAGLGADGTHRLAVADELARELQDHVKAETAPYKYPRIVEFAESLPKTASGKIRRMLLRDGFADSPPG